ncbi:prolyl-tRNA synthetase associated domain-containing protein [Kordiimonas lipolytica]|uniref:Prolyl-tRNA synthetase associated domain-containing protein n=1 Tax=Kordiimonas lipolytica TaxID=1662421 RepID=A0ABV8U6J7_9PROT|nr:prolyl-tRNA synthetase associated domain-containing protein [Kordiimonas lipolytica]
MESPLSEDDLFAFLAGLGIETETYRHAPVFTVEEAQAERAHMPAGGGHCKSLFVRDKKKRRALVMVDENRRVDLKALSGALSMGRLSFGSADSLMDMLGVIPGSVTPFALINARVEDGQEPPMLVALDAAMMAKSPLYYHPLHNAATTAISPDDLVRFIRACGYEPVTVDLDAPEPVSKPASDAKP